MKKAMALTAALAASFIPFRAYAAEKTADIHISITMEETVLDTALTVSDHDGDGKLTVDDALYEAHEQFYAGGAAAGYGDGFVWGRRCEGGYTLWNQDAQPLDADSTYTDRWEIRSGDVLRWSAQALSTERWSLDTDFYESRWYQAPVAQGTRVTFRAFHSIPTQRSAEPVEGAEILIDGNQTGIRTDASGKAEVTLNALGTHEITAVFAQNVAGDTGSYQFTVVPAKSIVDAHITILLRNTAAQEPELDCTFTVSDCDGDGRLTTDDALRLAHRYFGYPDAEITGLGQNRIWGRDGKFICEVYDGGTLVESGSAVQPNSEGFDLETGYRVVFRPKDKLDDEIVPVWMDHSSSGSVERVMQGANAVIAALHYLPDAVDPVPVKGAEVLIDGKETGIFTGRDGCAAIPTEHRGEHTLSFKVSGYPKNAVGSVMFEVVKAENAVDAPNVRQMTKLPANAPAKASAATVGSRQEKGVETGDSMPIAAAALAGMAVAVVVLAAPNRQKNAQNSRKS